MRRILEKCIGSENKAGFTFVEVMIIGVLVPLVVRNIKNYISNTNEHTGDQETYTA